MSEKIGAGTVVGVALALAIGATAGGALGTHDRKRAETDCAERGGVMQRFDREVLCVKPGMVLR
ncbi:hypothetical protein [Caulobacter segnis]